MSARIGLIDYGSGNLRSVGKALEHVGAKVRLVASPGELAGVDALVLPGVGAFGDCVRQLHERDLWTAAGDWVREDRPFFGVCLGYQMLFEASEESPGVPGLGIFAGNVQKFDETLGLKVPHMGWNSLNFAQASEAWDGLAPDAYVYFVHSYKPVPADASLVSAWCEYGGRFAAAIARGRLVATQFHPEKSQEVGLRILQNFVRSI